MHASEFVSVYSLPNGGSPMFSFSPDPADSTRALTCADAGMTNIFEVYLHDGQGGPPTWVTTYALLTDETDLCATGGAGQSFAAYNGLSYNLPAEGQLTIRAGDFIPCCPGNSMSYAFSPDPADQLLTVDCSDLGLGGPVNILVDIYGIEPGGSYSVASTYFILHDQYLYCDQGSFTPANDDACNAISLPVGPAACPLVGANINATAQAGEPAPPDGDCDAQDAWCDGQGAENSVWFTFEAPTSGSIHIRANYFNTQLALWEADSCTSITAGNAILVAANDDAPGSFRNEAALEGITCLIPGKTYYLQVDGYAGESGAFEFLIEDPGLSCGLAESVMICTPAANTSVSAGSNTWRHAFDGNGGLIASVADGGNSLGGISIHYQANEGDIRLDGADNPYLDRNWGIIAEQQPAAPVRLRLYFTREEFQALQGAGAGIETPADIFLTRVEEADCGPYTGGGGLISQEGYGLINDSDYYMDFLIPGFSALYLNGPEPLVSGLEGSSKNTEISLMPNPVKGMAFLNAKTSLAVQGKLAIYNSQGSIIYQQQLSFYRGQNRLPLNLGMLPPGVYIAKLTGQGFRWAGRFIAIK